MPIRSGCGIILGERVNVIDRIPRDLNKVQFSLAFDLRQLKLVSQTEFTALTPRGASKAFEFLQPDDKERGMWRAGARSGWSLTICLAR